MKKISHMCYRGKCHPVSRGLPNTAKWKLSSVIKLKGSSCRLKGNLFCCPPVGHLNFCSILPAPFFSVRATTTDLESPCLLTPQSIRDNTSDLSLQLFLVVWTIYLDLFILKWKLLSVQTLLRQFFKRSFIDPPKVLS